jgi:hypothetical protein
MYKPYSPEWHRQRNLREALETYFNEYVDIDVIYNDLLEVIKERSDKAYAEFEQASSLEKKIRRK